MNIFTILSKEEKKTEILSYNFIDNLSSTDIIAATTHSKAINSVTSQFFKLLLIIICLFH